jgi:4-hydroxybenzoate polyprenyltransferase
MTENTYLSILLLTGLLLPTSIGLWRSRNLTMALLGDLRIPRILHYVALAVLGWILHIRSAQPDPSFLPQIPSLQDALTFGLLVLCLMYAAVAAIITNNLEDLAADRISNPHRPLARGAVASRPYLWAAAWCQLAALLLAGLADSRMFWGILGVSLGYFVYSCRPLRLKRVPILSKALIGLNSWMVAVCGFALAGGSWLEFPWEWSLWILVPMSLSANFVDLKDTAGDGATGVWTLPVLLGEAPARHLIAGATLLSYGMGGYLLSATSTPWVLPLNLGAAALHVALLYRKPYDERWVFLVYVGSLFGLDFLLFLGRYFF